MTRTYLNEHPVPTHAESPVIRKYLDHGIGNRFVRVHHTGAVDYCGSTDPYDDRNPDRWHFAGWAEDILAEITERKARLAVIRDSAQPSHYERSD